MTERAKNAIRSTELKGSIQQYLPPKEVRKYFHEIDTEGKEILANTDWWQDLRMKAETGAGGWVWNWPSHAKKLDANDHVHRESSPLHYVMGELAPFYIERMWNNDRTRGIWAVWLGPFCSNGSTTMGVGQGGAISAIFDLFTAQLGSIFAQARAPTTQINVSLKRPTTPIPGAFKVECWVEKEENNRIYLKGELTDGKGGKPTATCEVTLARVKRKKKVAPSKL